MAKCIFLWEILIFVQSLAPLDNLDPCFPKCEVPNTNDREAICGITHMNSLNSFIYFHIYYEKKKNTLHQTIIWLVLLRLKAKNKEELIFLSE